MDKSTKVLLLDDDPTFSQEIAGELVSKGYFVVINSTSDEFVNSFDSESPNVVLLDKNLGISDGFEVIHFIRNHKERNATPVIMITGDSTIDTRREAIQLGADDILSKPLEIEELDLRIISSLRRSSSYVTPDQFLNFGELKISLKDHIVTLEGNVIALTTTEYRFLVELVAKKDSVQSRAWLASRLLSPRSYNERTLDVHVNSLRKKLGHYGNYIKTVRGRGYVFQTKTV